MAGHVHGHLPATFYLEGLTEPEERLFADGKNAGTGTPTGDNCGRQDGEGRLEHRAGAGEDSRLHPVGGREESSPAAAAEKGNCARVREAAVAGTEEAMKKAAAAEETMKKTAAAAVAAAVAGSP